MPSNPLTDPHWAQRSVDFIDRIVVFVRDHTTRPLVKSARVVVFGALVSIGVVSLLVLLSVAFVRGLQAALDSIVTHQASVWISYFVLSALFFVAGIALMKRRHERDP